MARQVTTSAELWQQARALRQRMRMLGQMIRGSFNRREVRCGKPNCRCARSGGHPCVTITWKAGGKTKTVYVAREYQREAELMCLNYRRHKELLAELSAVNLELVAARRPLRRRLTKS